MPTRQAPDPLDELCDALRHLQKLDEEHALVTHGQDFLHQNSPGPRTLEWLHELFTSVSDEPMDVDDLLVELLALVEDELMERGADLRHPVTALVTSTVEEDATMGFYYSDTVE
jgi:hypothetical protein